MAKRRTRITRRGAVVLVVLALLAAGLVGVAMVKLRSPACAVETDQREVGLDRTEAEDASRAVAEVVRNAGTRAQAASAVQARLDVNRDDAALIGDALSGRSRAALACRHGGSGDSEADGLDGAGLTGRAAKVRADLATSFGDLPLGGFAPGGVSEGHMPGSAHYEGRAIDVFFRPINAASKRHGWAVAQYLVANAQRLAINTVIFDDRIWSARRGAEGWRDYSVDTTGKPAATARILEHRDHVHVDVAD